MHHIPSLQALTLNKIAKDQVLSNTITTLAPQIPRGQLGYMPVDNVLGVQRGFLALPVELQKTYLQTRAFLKHSTSWVTELDKEQAKQSQWRTNNAVAIAIYAHGPCANTIDKNSAEAFIELNFREINVAILCTAYLKHGENASQKLAVAQLQAENLVDITQSIRVLKEINGPLSSLYPTTADGKTLRDYALKLDRNLLAQHDGSDCKITDVPTRLLEKLPVG